MNKGTIHYAIGIVLLILVISFLFYSSLSGKTPLLEASDNIEEVLSLQVQLHRDLLRYRNNQIQQYDTLNSTLTRLDEKISKLNSRELSKEGISADSLNSLKSAIDSQSLLIEDFKIHHSILKNSIFYIFNLASDIYSTSPESKIFTNHPKIIRKLIPLLLEYNESSDNNVANRIYPLIDQLNRNPSTEIRSLINHSLMIIERLPEIDEILARFNSLNIENQIIEVKDSISALQERKNNEAQTFNILLFLLTIYLIVYIVYIFFSLKKNQRELSSANKKMMEEVNLRAKTENALYQLVLIDDNNQHNDDDRILFLLNALCTALDVEYAYIIRFSTSHLNAEVIGLLDHGMFTSNFSYQVTDTPCEEVIKNGRLVHNRDFANYFPQCHDQLLKSAESYIGVRLTDSNDNVIGMIAIASDKPIIDTSLAENILTIASSRAVIELEYQIELDNSKRYQSGLALIDDWIARLITEGYDKTAFYKNVCRAAQEITKAQLAGFPVLLSDKQNFKFLSTSGLQSAILEKTASHTEKSSLCTNIIKNHKILMINDINTDEEFKKQFPSSLKSNAALIAPVTLNEQPYGAIAVFKDFDEFDHIDEQLINQFSQSVQMAIINMQLVSDIRSERERAEVTLHSIGDAVITTNINGEIEYMNHVAEALTAWKLDDARNIPIQDVFRIEDMDTGEPIHDVVKSCLFDGITINKSILCLISKKNNKKDIESSISPILNTSGKAEGVVIVFHDETQRRQLENTIKHQAAHDTLTNLLNREAFDRALTEVLFDAKHKENHHILCYLDLDRFKLINDTAGHNAGDQCLIQVSSLIQTCIRNNDILGRLGGDEFGLILKNCTQESALKLCENIIKTISEMHFNWDGCDYKLGISIGINPLDNQTTESSDAIRKADLACYTAKDNGKNRAYIYEEQDSELKRRQEETYWATRITDAIDNNRLRLYAQPIVPLGKRYVQENHVEILVRLEDEEGLLITPNAFIPAAERYHLMHLIDRKVIQETFDFISRFEKHDEFNTHFSINISGNTLGDVDIISQIRALVTRYNIATKNICFEITETAAIKNLQQAKTLIKELRSDGFKFALDDFGSGLSSFQYLKNLEVDYLKIDGSFVADMVNNNIDRAMVAAINQVGHTMGIETIAEFVENEQIIKKLQDINVDYGQGYGIEQPKPIEEALSFHDREKSRPFKLVHNKP